MSPPAQKALSPLASIITRAMLTSVSHSINAFSIESIIEYVSEFNTSGRFKVIWPTQPDFRIKISSGIFIQTK